MEGCIMIQLNLKLGETLAERTTQLAKRLGMKRTAYIRQALDEFNEKNAKILLAEQFHQASAKCREESLKVCQEFERIDNLKE